MVEHWKKIINTKHEVSNLGRVRNEKGKILKGNINSNGYHRVIQKLTHLLVANAFIENPYPEKFNIVNHKNCNKLDNRVENLEWIDKKGNAEHAIINRLTYTRTVEQYNIDTGETIKIFNSIAEAARELNIGRRNISACARGRQKSVEGLYFKYIDGKEDKQNIDKEPDSEWKKILQAPTYFISNKGQVYSTYSKKVMKPYESGGYEIIQLSIDKKGLKFYVHSLVANAFIPNPENLPIIDHIDRNKLNNNVSNLRWSDVRSNNKNRDFSNFYKKKIQCIHPDETIEFFNGVLDAAKKFNTSVSNIYGCLNGNQHTAKGCKWNYIEELV